MADWQTLARRTAKQVGVDPDIFVRLVGAESTGNPNAKSPAGAIGYTQLMPGTARGLGVDPYNPRQNLVGGARYLKQQLGRFGNYSDALRAYNAGPGAVKQSHGYAETNAYVQRILGGSNPTVTRGTRTTGGTVAPSSPGTGGLGELGELGGSVGDTGGAGDVSALLGLINQPRAAPSSIGLQAPAFSARPAMPGGYQAPVSGGGPTPPPDINQLLQLVRTQAGTTGTPGALGGTSGTTSATPGGTGGTGGTAAPAVTGPPPRAGTGGYPLARHGPIIGVPHQGTHTLGNWQSDNAVDIRVPIGTPVEAVTGGRVIKVRYGGPPSSQFGGYQITIQGPNGGLFYTHLSKAGVRPGQKIKPGSILGLSGAANGVPHLHFGVQNGDPRHYLK
jgi:murein DD-endopeptidase MepM/ murein hydrolase activator NlpD